MRGWFLVFAKIDPVEQGTAEIKTFGLGTGLVIL
jgi:hypothetical protein